MPKSDVPVKDISGKEVTLESAKKDNGLLVMFTCNSCPYVINNQSRTKEICSYAISKNIGVVLLNANKGERHGNESLDNMKAYAKAQNYQWYYAIDRDHEIADAFGAKRTPECFLFDKKGVLIYHGAIDDSPGDIANVKRRHLQEAINEMIAGKDITVKHTRSVGCSINRG